MPTNETNGLMTVKDNAGNLYIVYPITKVSNIEGLDLATASVDGLMSAADKAKLDIMRFTVGVNATGPYIKEV